MVASSFAQLLQIQLRIRWRIHSPFQVGQRIFECSRHVAVPVPVEFTLPPFSSGTPYNSTQLASYFHKILGHIHCLP